MRKLVVLLVVVLAMFSGGCAASFRLSGGPFSLIPALTEGVKVSNSTIYTGIIERDGQTIGKIEVGQSCVVNFGFALNMLLSFKAVTADNEGRLTYIGLAEQSFYASQGGYGNRTQSWIVNYVQRPNR